jgi:hypothetical protein
METSVELLLGLKTTADRGLRLSALVGSMPDSMNFGSVARKGSDSSRCSSFKPSKRFGDEVVIPIFEPAMSDQELEGRTSDVHTRAVSRRDTLPMETSPEDGFDEASLGREVSSYEGSPDASFTGSLRGREHVGRQTTSSRQTGSASRLLSNEDVPVISRRQRRVNQDKLDDHEPQRGRSAHGEGKDVKEELPFPENDYDQLHGVRIPVSGPESQLLYPSDSDSVQHPPYPDSPFGGRSVGTDGSSGEEKQPRFRHEKDSRDVSGNTSASGSSRPSVAQSSDGSRRVSSPRREPVTVPERRPFVFRNLIRRGKRLAGRSEGDDGGDGVEVTLLLFPITLRSVAITNYWTVPLILDHSYLVGRLTSSKIADTKVSGF